MSETDKEFVADMEWLHSHDCEAALPPEKLARLFALARRRAEAAAEIERLKAELEQCQQTLYRQIGLTIEASEEATKASATEIERLRAALEVFACDCEGKAICLGNCMHRNARAVLEGK